MHLQYLKRFYSNFKGKKILDLGCGRGDFLLECYKEKLDVVGIDINPDYIKISQEKIKKNGYKPNILLASGEKLPFENEYFDFINCIEVIEHTNNPEQVLREIYRVLKPDGKVFLTIHNRLGFKDAHYKLPFLNWMPRFMGEKYIKFAGKQKDASCFLDLQSISKMHYFSYKRIGRLFKKVGFKFIDVRRLQITNPELILNSKFKKIFGFSKKIKLNALVRLLYDFANLIYFNTFHFILEK